MTTFDSNPPIPALTQQLGAMLDAAPEALSAMAGNELERFEQLVDELQKRVIKENVARMADAAFAEIRQQTTDTTQAGVLPVEDEPVTELIPAISVENDRPLSASA